MATTTPRLLGKTAAITGAASGLGRAIAERFADEGASALALLDVDESALQATATELSARGVARISTARVDVRDEAEMEGAIADFAASAGRLDVMVNNAGVLSPSRRLHGTASTDFERVLHVNVLGVFHGLKAALQIMRVQGDGSIINTASVSGMTAWSHAGPYCASKAAVIHLTKVAAIEYATEGIRVNCVCPGTFESAIHDGLSDEAMERLAARHPIGRLATVEEIVGAYVYLASDESSYATGSALLVDGGYSAL